MIYINHVNIYIVTQGQPICVWMLHTRAEELNHVNIYINHGKVYINHLDVYKSRKYIYKPCKYIYKYCT